MKANWLQRGLINTPIRYTLATSEEMLHEKMRWLRVPRGSWPKWAPKGVGGSCVQLEDGDGHACAVIMVYPSVVAEGSIPVAVTIVHEAMHLWRWTREILGEKEPSSEFEAYAMENICSNLFEEYVSQTQ